MKVHGYKVETDGQVPLEVRLKDIYGLDLGSRGRIVRANKVRIEQLQPKRGKDYLLLDFGMLRAGHGPGKGQDSRETSGIALGEKERFSELTAALYVPQARTLLVQYNHHGVRGGGIAQYAEEFASSESDGYNLEPMLDPAVHAKLKKFKYTKKLIVRIAASKITESVRDTGLPVTAAMELRDAYGFDNFELTMNFAASTKGSAGIAVKLLSKLGLGKYMDQENIFPKLLVAGKETLDATTEILDLRKHRLCLEKEITLDKTQRFPLEQRWQTLEDALLQWKKYI